MIGRSTSPTLKESIKHSRRIFSAAGWKVTKPPVIPQDLRVDKDILKFNIQFVDISALDYKSYSDIRETAKGNSTQSLLTSAPMPFIFNFVTPPEFTSSLLKEGVVSLHIEELELITHLSKILENELPDINERQELLIEYNPWVCVKLAGVLVDQGHTAAGAEWAMRALRHARAVSGLHHSVFNILRKAGNRELAHKVASEAVTRSKSDVTLLRGLHKMAQESGDSAEIERWHNMLRDAGVDSGKHGSSNIERLFNQKPIPQREDKDDLVSGSIYTKATVIEKIKSRLRAALRAR